MPTAIINYLQGARQQLASANAMMSSAASAPSTLDAMERLQSDRASVARQFPALRPAEREQIEQYLSQRQSELAPAVTSNWLAAAGSESHTPDTPPGCSKSIGAWLS